jgi:hypothetical protein
VASRTVEIKFTGEAGNYVAEVNRIIEKNNQLNRAATQGAEQTTAAFGNLKVILNNLPSLFGGIASGIASAFSIGAITAFIKQVIGAAGEIDDLAKKTGFTRQTLSGLKSTIEENGGSLQAFASAVNKMQKSLGDVEGSGKQAAAALAAMGLNVQDLTKLSPEQAFEKFAEALSHVEGQNKRAAIATQVMSRAGADQIPVILELTDKFKKLRDEGANELTIKALDAVGDAFVRMKNKTVIAAQEGIVDILRFFGVVRDSARVAADVQSATQTAAKVLNLATGKIEGMSSKEIIAAAEKAPEGIKRSAILARDALLNAREEFDRLQTSEKDKPAIGGGSLPAVDEGAAKRQLDALEAATTALMRLKLANAEAARAAGDHTVEVRALALALIDQEYTAAIKTAQANKSYTVQLGEVLLAEKALKVAQFESAEAALKTKQYIEDANQELETQADDAKTTAEAWGFYKKSQDDAAAASLKLIETTKQVSDLEADRLTIIGKTTEAEQLRLLTQLKYLQALKDQEGVDSLQIPLRNAQIKLVETQIQQLGTVTVNVGQTIANSVGDAFEGVILGTRKLADIGKGLMAALLRDIGSFFSQALIKKLGFENILLTNATQIGPQIAGAVSSGGGTSGGGGIIGNLVSTIGKLGGGFSSLLSGLGSLLSGGGGSFGFGSAAAGVAGPAFANGGFFSGISGAAGGSGIVGNIINGLSTAWTAFSNTTLVTTIGSAITEVGATIATTLTTVLDTITAALANPVTWIAAIVVAAITAIYRIIANQQERPNAKFSGIFQGVSFNETSQQFVPGDINVQIGRKSGIKNSDAGKIADNLQQRLTVLAVQWTDILNIFPDFIEKDIQPALDETNRRLNQNFKDLKFSPGGSRDIQQELESLSGYAGLFRFFQAFAPSIEQGFRSSLQGGGIQIGSAAGFANLDPNRGFKFGAPQEDWDKFIAAIKDVAGLTSQLGSVGAGKFLTGSDLTNIGGLFDQLFSVTDSTTFVKAAAELKDKLKPALDFLTQSVQESTDLFGRGLMAALQATSESDAIKAFTESLGAGVKDAIFNGIIQSFVASAQFGDLLAPIQQQIREFTQQALASGTPPDIEAFRKAILPAIEAISSRAGVLAPLIAELQKLGLDVTDAITSLFGPEALKPVDEFLQASIKSATDLFQRGLIAALDAATSSQANEVFLQSLGAGVKDILFKGITDAFIASAQFDELLLPIQKTIQAFTAEATASGRTPDLAAFRAAILPQIGDLSARAATLAPLIAALQDLGFSFKDALKVFDPATAAVPKVEINIENFNRDDDPAALARQIQALLGGRLAPAA